VGANIDLRAPAALFEPDGAATVEVKGESQYQGTLERIAGGRTIDGGRQRDHIALLLPEPTNPYDHNAVRVMLTPTVERGTGGLVGYLSREDAVAFRQVIDRLAGMGKLLACRASLKGGWDRGGGDRGSFGVTLHLDRPFVLMADMDRQYGQDPAWLVVSPAQIEAANYDRTTCPSCGQELPRPLPKAKKACRSCGQAVCVRTKEGVRHLLTEAGALKWDHDLFG
jgi:predicted RNA-binding Zn-ribbon protein involved in translation (DUF1610 family)